MPGVYLLHDPVTNFLKIGRATNLDDRLANLRTANPRLVLLEWIETKFESSVES
jgi:excinuclease UvrABC nuclease subunit